MNATKVKICGITRKEDLASAAAAGADAVGFVVDAVASPRNLPLETAAKLFRQVPPFVKSVLVTVPTTVDNLVENYKKLNPDIIQIHGENLRNVALIRKKIPNTPLMKSVNANSPDALEKASTTAKIFDCVVLDSLSQGHYGGTGLIHNWTLGKHIKSAIHPVPLILAGGLNPENVGEAVRLVQPYAVDVSSGVELKPGIKNNQKMVAFVRNAKDV